MCNLCNMMLRGMPQREVIMKALVYYGPGKKDWVEKPKPVVLEPTDVIVKISKTTICGSDLHILKGDVPPLPKAARSAMKASASLMTLAAPCAISRKAMRF